LDWNGSRSATGDLWVKSLANKNFLRLGSVFLASSFRLYARKTKLALTIALFVEESGQEGALIG
jgi:hypothetical protein